MVMKTSSDRTADTALPFERVRDVVRIGGSGAELTAGQLRFTPRAKKVLELAQRERLAFRDGYLTTVHILLALAWGRRVTSPKLKR